MTSKKGELPCQENWTLHPSRRDNSYGRRDRALCLKTKWEDGTSSLSAAFPVRESPPSRFTWQIDSEQPGSHPRLSQRNWAPPRDPPRGTSPRKQSHMHTLRWE